MWARGLGRIGRERLDRVRWRAKPLEWEGRFMQDGTALGGLEKSSQEDRGDPVW